MPSRHWRASRNRARRFAPTATDPARISPSSHCGAVPASHRSRPGTARSIRARAGSALSQAHAAARICVVDRASWLAFSARRSRRKEQARAVYGMLVQGDPRLVTDFHVMRSFRSTTLPASCSSPGSPGRWAVASSPVRAASLRRRDDRNRAAGAVAQPAGRARCRRVGDAAGAGCWRGAFARPLSRQGRARGNRQFAAGIASGRDRLCAARDLWPTRSARALAVRKLRLAVRVHVSRLQCSPPR